MHPLSMGSRFVVEGDSNNPHAVAVVLALADDANRHFNGGQAGELYHVELLTFYSAAELRQYAPGIPSRRLDQCRVVRVQLPPLPLPADGRAEPEGDGSAQIAASSTAEESRKRTQKASDKDAPLAARGRQLRKHR